MDQLKKTSTFLPRPFTVVLGGDTLTDNEDTKQTFTSVSFFPHPKYDGHANDIMLLKVSDQIAEKKVLCCHPDSTFYRDPI